MSALLSGNLEISIGASKIFINLLEYQNNNQLTVRTILVFLYYNNTHKYICSVEPEEFDST